MRVAEAYGEAMFLTVRLEDLAPATHPLRPILKWINNAVMELLNAAVEMARRKGQRWSRKTEHADKWKSCSDGRG
jgi:hypothetical protein